MPAQSVAILDDLPEPAGAGASDVSAREQDVSCGEDGTPEAYSMAWQVSQSWPIFFPSFDV